MPGSTVSLRLKAFITITVVVVLGTAALCAVLWRLSADSFNGVEADIVTRDAERARGIVEADQASLSRTTVDWAEWDDTFNFVEASALPADTDEPDAATTVEDYLEGNLVPSTFKQNRISVLAVLDTEGTTLYSGSYDPASDTVSPDLDAALAEFGTTRATQAGAGAKGPYGGIVVGEGADAWEAAAVPILRSDKTGPTNGVLLMARALDRAALDRFGDTLRLPLELAPITSVDLTRPDLRGLAGQAPRYAASVGGNTSRGYATLPTLDGAAPVVLSFEESSSVAALSDTQQTQLAAMLILMGALMAFVMIVLADKYVLSRIMDMSHTVDGIARSGDVSMRIADTGHDEIGSLALATNTMLARVETTTTALESARAGAEAGRRAKNEFLANMSHELRTPLHAVLGMTRLARETDRRVDRNEMLTTVEDAATTLLSMVEDVLVLSEEEAGTLELNPAPFSPAALVGGLATEGAAAAQPGVEVHAVVPEDVAPELIGDLCRIRHCLANLVDNAAKFTPSGSVVISVAQIQGDELPGDGSDPDEPSGLWLRFVVADTGVGILAERLADVQHAFEQADTSSTRRYGGTGIGITVASRLARRMGGDLVLESEPETGTTATVTIPVDPAPSRSRVTSAAFSPPAEPSAGTEPMSVLVVEDNQVNQRVARRMLEKSGHRVHVVEDGAQAVEAVAAGGVDIVLMDIQMPVMDGLEASRRIRSAEAGSGRHIPIVALTAHAMAGDRERCIEAGMDAYVTKPFNAETLASALAEVNRPRRVCPGGRDV